MKKSRKLALVVLGMVVVALLGMGLRFSSLYSDWEPRVGFVGRTPLYWKLRKQRLPWLPGSDRESAEISEEEWVELGGYFEPKEITYMEGK